MKNSIKTIKFALLIVVVISFVFARVWVIYFFKKENISGKVVFKEINIYPEKEGKVINLNCKENDIVNKDDLLVEIDISDIKAKISRLKKEIDLEKANINLAKNDEKKKLEEYLNCKKDDGQNEKVLNEKLKSLEELQLKNKINKAKIEFLISKLSQLEIEEKKAFIYSPCAGKVLDVQTIKGQNLIKKQKLFTILDEESIWVESKIKKNALEKIKNNLVNFVFQEYKNKKFQGKVFFEEEDKVYPEYFLIKLSINQIKSTPNEKVCHFSPNMKADIFYE